MCVLKIKVMKSARVALQTVPKLFPKKFSHFCARIRSEKKREFTGTKNKHRSRRDPVRDDAPLAARGGTA